jgi:hypothetical protein
VSSKAEFQRVIGHALTLADLVHVPPLEECDEVSIVMRRRNESTAIVVKTDRRDVEVGNLVVNFDASRKRRKPVVYVQPHKAS